MSNALLTYIETKNAKTAAWVAEDPANRWAGMLVADVAHWAASGVTTPDELERYLLACDVYESTRSVWGYKPSWSGLMSLSLEALQAEAQALAEACERQRTQREQDERAEYEQEVREENEHVIATARAMTRTEWKLDMVFPS